MHVVNVTSENESIIMELTCPEGALSIEVVVRVNVRPDLHNSDLNFTQSCSLYGKLYQFFFIPEA